MNCHPMFGTVSNGNSLHLELEGEQPQTIDQSVLVLVDLLFGWPRPAAEGNLLEVALVYI